MNLIYQWTEKIRDKVAKLNDKGQGMVEYAIILAAVALIAGAVLYTNGTSGTNGLQSAVNGAFSKAKTNVESATNGNSSQDNQQDG